MAGPPRSGGSRRPLRGDDPGSYTPGGERGRRRWRRLPPLARCRGGGVRVRGLEGGGVRVRGLEGGCVGACGLVGGGVRVRGLEGGGVREHGPGWWRPGAWSGGRRRRSVRPGERREAAASGRAAWWAAASESGVVGGRRRPGARPGMAASCRSVRGMASFGSRCGRGR
jgi:hypothetical protein